MMEVPTKWRRLQAWSECSCARRRVSAGPLRRSHDLTHLQVVRVEILQRREALHRRLCHIRTRDVVLDRNEAGLRGAGARR